MPDPILLQYTLTDDAGKAESVEYFADPSSTLTDLQTEVLAFTPLLDLVTGAVVASASARFPMPLPGAIKTTPTADYLNSRGALLGFDVVDSKYRWSNRIPAILAAFIVQGDIAYDPADALDDLIQQILGSVNVPYVNRYGDLLTGIIGTSLSLHKKPR